MACIRCGGDACGSNAGGGSMCGAQPAAPSVTWSPDYRSDRGFTGDGERRCIPDPDPRDAEIATLRARNDAWRDSHALLAERYGTLRTAIRDLVNSLGNGACIATDASDEFHALGCREALVVVKSLRARVHVAYHNLRSIGALLGVEPKHDEVAGAALPNLADLSEALRERLRAAEDAKARAAAAEKRLAEVATICTHCDGATERAQSGGMRCATCEARDERLAELEAKLFATDERLAEAETELVSAGTQLAEVTAERDRLTLTNATIAADIAAIGAACGIRDDEYPLKAVQRVVAEHDAIRSTLKPLVEAYEKAKATREKVETYATTYARVMGRGEAEAARQRAAQAIADAAVRLLGTGGGE